MSTNKPQRPDCFFAKYLTLRQFVTSRSMWAVLAIICVVGVSAGIGASSKPPQPELLEDQAATAVEVARVRQVPEFQQQRSFTGIVKSRRASDLSFERSARLVSVDVDEGDAVRAGQILARLDTRQLAARMRELEARKAQAESVLEELISGPRAETIAAARASVRELEAELERLQSSHQRNEKLRRDNAVSESEFERSQFGMASAEARLDAAQRKLDELLAGTRQEQIDAQRAAVSQLVAAIENLKIDIDDSGLAAPFDGRVATRYVDEGTVVAPSQPIVRIVEAAKLEAWIGLPVDLAAEVKVGHSYDVVVNGHPSTARVKSVMPELDLRTRTRSVVLELSGDADRFALPGQIVRIEVEDRVEEVGFWLPTAALTRGTRGLWSVLAVQTDQTGEDRVGSRDVEVLHTDGDRVFVRGTLREGDQVIIGGTHRVVSGQRVVAIVKETFAAQN